jgi:hypothetical protein
LPNDRGSAKLKSGETLQVIASDIAAKENLTLIGKNVDLSAAQNTSDDHQTASSKSSGFSVGVTVNPIAAAKDAYKESTKNSKSSGTIGKFTSKADGVADGLWATTTAVTVQFGSKSSTSTQNQSTSEARTTSLNAGKDGNFNNSAYKVFYENVIKKAIDDPNRTVGETTIKFDRTNPASPRPDRLTVTYIIDGEPTTVHFKNEANGAPKVKKP